MLINEQLSCSCDGFWRPASTIQETTEYMVKLIVIWSGSVDYSGICRASRGDGPLTLQPAFTSFIVEDTSYGKKRKNAV